MNSRTFNPFKLLVDSVKYEMKTFSFKVNKKEYKFGYQLIHFSLEDDYEGILVQWNTNEKITVSGKTEDDIIEGLKTKILSCGFY